MIRKLSPNLDPASFDIIFSKNLENLYVEDHDAYYLLNFITIGCKREEQIRCIMRHVSHTEIRKIEKIGHTGVQYL